MDEVKQYIRENRRRESIMTTAQKNLMLRVVKRRVNTGEAIDDILTEYPKLTDEEKESIKAELEVVND